MQGQGRAQFVRDVRQELVLEFQLLFLTHVQRPQQPLPFHGIAYGPLQMLAGDVAFNQVILHSLVDRLEGQSLIVLAGEHHHRHIGRVFQHAAEGFRAAAVGQVQVQQHHGGCFPGQRSETLGQTRDTIYIHPGFAFDQAKADQVGISRVVFDQQYLRGWLVHYSPTLLVLAGWQSRTRILQST
jgi:hypothetical protein